MLLATLNLPKSLTFLGNFCKCVKINHISSEITFGRKFYRHLAIFFWSHCSLLIKGLRSKVYDSLFFLFLVYFVSAFRGRVVTILIVTIVSSHRVKKTFYSLAESTRSEKINIEVTKQGNHC